jgi:Fic family protein
LINCLPLLEAQASSEIENIVTTTDRLFRFQREDQTADPATKEALRYSHALLEGYRSLSDRPLTTRTAEEICSRVKGMEMQVRRVPGTALAREPSGEIIYTPPVGEQALRTMLANWERFMHEREEIDPLIRMAVGHYQFEAIHPFTDGNGRTGRILNSLFLISQNLLTLPTLYLSRYIIQNKADYYQLLLEVTAKQAWQEWVRFIVTGVEQTARWTVEKIAAIRSLQMATSDHIKNFLPKIYSYELSNLIFELPYCRINNLTDRNIAARQTASNYLKDLVRMDVLTEHNHGREKLFAHPRFIRLLTTDSNTWEPFRNEPNCTSSTIV